MQYFALDVVGELALGEALGFLANDRDMYRYLEMNDAFFPVLSVLLTVPWVDRWMRVWPFSLALPRVGDEVGFGVLMGYVFFFLSFLFFSFLLLSAFAGRSPADIIRVRWDGVC